MLAYGLRGEWGSEFPPPNQPAPNYLGSREARHKCRLRFQSEVRAGRMIGGPGWTSDVVRWFLGGDFYITPCGAVPKGDDPHGRIVHNYSHTFDGISLNSVLDPSALASLTCASHLTIPALRSIATLASPIDVLRIISPQKAVALTSSVKHIMALADYVQSVCGHLAANEALEPAHAVICQVLRTGANFEHAKISNPIHLAAAAVAPLCHTPDVDGKLEKTPSRRSNPGRRRGYCYSYQRGSCDRTSCIYKHACAICDSPAHGDRACPSRN